MLSAVAWQVLNRVCAAFASIAALAIAASACSASAESLLDESEHWHVGITATSLGPGIEISRSVGRQFAVRGVFNTMALEHTKTVRDVRYVGDLELQTGGLLIDWQPNVNGVRFTAGLLLNGTQLRVDAAPRGGDVEFRGQTYASTQIGSAKGKGEFNRLSPYLGVGYAYAFGSADRFQASLDVGVLYQGNLGVDVSVHCGVDVPAPLCDRLTNDVQSQARHLEHAAHFSTYYPVLSLGLRYRLSGG